MDDQRTRAGRPRNPALDRAILSAAARQLGELGYARMSLESVAAAAGTTVPSLRRRYQNKAGLAAAGQVAEAHQAAAANLADSAATYDAAESDSTSAVHRVAGS